MNLKEYLKLSGLMQIKKQNLTISKSSHKLIMLMLNVHYFNLLMFVPPPLYSILSNRALLVQTVFNSIYISTYFLILTPLFEKYFLSKR